MTKLGVGSNYILLGDKTISIHTIKEHPNQNMVEVLILFSTKSNIIGKSYLLRKDSYIFSEHILFPHPIPSNLEELTNLYPEYFL